MKSWSKHSSLGEYLQTLAEVYGDNPCISELRSGRILSYIELESQSRSAAAQLFDMGLQVGDQFGMITRNQIEFFVWYLAALRSGIWIVPINYDSPVSDIENTIKSFNIRGVIGADAIIGTLAPLRKKLEFLYSFSHFNLLDGHRLIVEKSYWSIGSLYFSSGTTGEPKGIPQSAGNLLSAG